MSKHSTIKASSKSDKESSKKSGSSTSKDSKIEKKKTPTEDLEEHGYTIGQILGEGSYSKVRCARFEGKDIAVKIISRNKLSREFATKFLPREIDILSKVKHKYIIKVYKIFNYSDRVYIFMERIQRGDLLTYIRNRGKLSESEARHFFRQMVCGMRHLHSMNVTHRDLKCENIMIDDEDRIRIIDFGFCRSVVEKSNGKRQLSETFCGSTAYAAPEVLQGNPYNPMMYDVWSLGCVLFIMVTGTMPFDDSHVRTLIQVQLKRELRFPSSAHLTHKVKELIRNMLEPDVTRRYSLERVSKSNWLMGSTNSILFDSSNCSKSSHSANETSKEEPQKDTAT